MRRVAVILLSFTLSGCAAKAPVFYHNAHYDEVGKGKAEQDFKECRELAKQNVPSSPVAGVASQAVVGGGAGAAIGAAGGAAHGNAGGGAAAGAASGAVAGLLRGIFQSREPNAIERNYIESCLRERGYGVVGWK